MNEREFKERWSQLHGGADTEGVVGGWLSFSYQAARVCAALRISPNFITLLGLATAIAMGGAALLPDMGFTLSGNVAFYEGAQAMALNAAAKVGANAFVTASVGGGLNKNGSVGGRVGFVFGF